MFSFFSPGEGVDDVLMSLSSIEEIINVANLMSITFSVEHSKTFKES